MASLEELINRGSLRLENAGRVVLPVDHQYFVLTDHVVDVYEVRKSGVSLSDDNDKIHTLDDLKLFCWIYTAEPANTPTPWEQLKQGAVKYNESNWPTFSTAAVSGLLACSSRREYPIKQLYEEFMFGMDDLEGELKTLQESPFLPDAEKAPVLNALREMVKLQRRERDHTD